MKWKLRTAVALVVAVVLAAGGALAGLEFSRPAHGLGAEARIAVDSVAMDLACSLALCEIQSEGPVVTV